MSHRPHVFLGVVGAGLIAYGVATLSGVLEWPGQHGVRSTTSALAMPRIEQSCSPPSPSGCALPTSAGYSMRPPANWIAGRTQTFNVKVTNTGHLAWLRSGSNQVMLDIHFSTSDGGSTSCCWLTNQVFALPSDVPSGGSVIVSVSATPPSTPGQRYLEAQMLETGQFWFGQWQATPVTVGAAVWSATYSTTPPTRWISGQSRTVTVTLTNTGNTTWAHSGTDSVELDWHFATFRGGSTSCCWLTNQAFALPADVAPGDSITMHVTVIAPDQPGSFYLEAEMFESGHRWFDQWSAHAVTVG